MWRTNRVHRSHVRRAELTDRSLPREKPESSHAHTRTRTDTARHEQTRSPPACRAGGERQRFRPTQPPNQHTKTHTTPTHTHTAPTRVRPRPGCQRHRFAAQLTVCVTSGSGMSVRLTTAPCSSARAVRHMTRSTPGPHTRIVGRVAPRCGSGHAQSQALPPIGGRANSSERRVSAQHTMPRTKAGSPKHPAMNAPRKTGSGFEPSAKAP